MLQQGCKKGQLQPQAKFVHHHDVACGFDNVFVHMFSREQ